MSFVSFFALGELEARKLSFDLSARPCTVGLHIATSSAELDCGESDDPELFIDGGKGGDGDTGGGGCWRFASRDAKGCCKKAGGGF